MERALDRSRHGLAAMTTTPTDTDRDLPRPLTFLPDEEEKVPLVCDPPDCNGHGVCEAGECQCEVGFVSNDLDSRFANCASQAKIPTDIPTQYVVPEQVPASEIPGANTSSWRTDDGSNFSSEEYATSRSKGRFWAWDKSPMCGGVGIRDPKSNAELPTDDREFVCPAQSSIVASSCALGLDLTDTFMALPDLKSGNDCHAYDVKNVRCDAMNVSDFSPEVSTQCIGCIARPPNCGVITRWVACLQALLETPTEHEEVQVSVVGPELDKPDLPIKGPWSIGL